MTIENVKCPECDGEMVSRSGKFGVFWGCKKFPECKGTRDNMGRSKEDRYKEKFAKDVERDVENEEWPSNKEGKISWNKK